MTAQIVSAHVKANSVSPDALPDLIRDVHQAVSSLGAAPPPPAERPQPAVPIKKSIFPDYIVCLEDGKKLKMLKRHLMSAYNLTPEQYRERWGLGRPITRWWRRTMRSTAPRWPRRSAWARADAGPPRPEPSANTGLQFDTAPQDRLRS